MNLNLKVEQLMLKSPRNAETMVVVADLTVVEDKDVMEVDSEVETEAVEIVTREILKEDAEMVIKMAINLEIDLVEYKTNHGDVEETSILNISANSKKVDKKFLSTFF